MRVPFPRNWTRWENGPCAAARNGSSPPSGTYWTKPTDLASSAAEGTVHQATEGTVLFLTAVRWHRQDLQRQATVFVIAPKLQLSTFITVRRRRLFRRPLTLPSPEHSEGFIEEGRDSSDFTRLRSDLQAQRRR